METVQTAGDTVDSLAASVGSLIHLYLEMVARSGCDAWSRERIRSLLPAMALWLTQHGYSATDARLGAARTAEVMQATLASETGRWVLKSRSSGSAELALNRLDGEPDRQQLATHIIDRSFVEDGQRWIIDYKTAQVADAGSGATLQAHAERYRLQLERYGRLFDDEGLPQRLAIFYVAHGQLIELSKRGATRDVST
jgi:ATP-dependent exoDNAse (exonuclease V) beta subunit